VFKKRGPRKIFGPKSEEVTGYWKSNRILEEVTGYWKK
jgi:hypothetical protein